MIELGERLKQLRLNKNLNQQQLAQLLNCTSSVISSYELNVRKPSLDNLMSLARIFNVSTDYILGINNNRDPNLIDLTGVSDRERVALKQLIEVMKKK